MGMRPESAKGGYKQYVGLYLIITLIDDWGWVFVKCVVVVGRSMNASVSVALNVSTIRLGNCNFL